jgi:uncharacterized protein YkwD
LPKKSQNNLWLELILAVAAVAVLAVPFSSGAANAVTPGQYQIESLTRQLNADRLAHGLAPLKRSAQLDRAAQLKVADMIQLSYFAHRSPQGLDPWHWFLAAGYQYQYAGENLALDFNNAQAVQQAWLDSPSHRQNILNDKYTEVGYALAYGTFRQIDGQDQTRAGLVIVQLFGQPETNQPPPKPDWQPTGLILALAGGANLKPPQRRRF